MTQYKNGHDRSPSDEARRRLADALVDAPDEADAIAVVVDQPAAGVPDPIGEVQAGAQTTISTTGGDGTDG